MASRIAAPRQTAPGRAIVAVIPRREPLRPAKRAAATPATPVATATSAIVAAAPPPSVEPSEHEPPAPVVVPPPAPFVLPPPAPPIQLVRAPVAGSLDATPAVVSLDVKGSLSPSIVRRSVERTLTSLRGCYRTAARAGQSTPELELRLAFEIDENSRATHVATSGGSFGSLASCAAGVASQIRTQEAPDVGTAQVTVVIGFRPS